MEMPDEVREFFRKQGSIGGKRRMRKLSPQERTEIARKAATSRWADGTAKKSDKAPKSKLTRKSKTRNSK
jgi:hypothetical protein